jgi:magnesium-transporting ATPase (P-type)
VQLQLLKLMTQCIIFNTEARIEMDDKNHCYIPEGNPVEVGLLNFLTSINVPVQDQFVDRERNWKLLTLIPFSSDRKRMTVAYYNNEQQYVTVVVKGAPEIIVPMCTQQLDHSFDPVEFDGARKQG